MPTTRRLTVLLVLISSSLLGCGMRSVLETDIDGKEEPAVIEPDAGTGAAGTKGGVGAPCGHGGTCDPENLGGETCRLLGAGGGELSCDPVTCIFDLSLCTGTIGTGNGTGNGNGNGQGGTTGGGATNPGNGNNGQGGTTGGGAAGTGFFGGGGTAGTGFFGGGGTAGSGN